MRAWHASVMAGILFLGCSEKAGAPPQPATSATGAPTTGASAPTSRDEATAPPGGADAGAPADCDPGDERIQRRGTDCLCCHAWEFGYAGSVDPSSPEVDRVEATDEDGVTAIMSPNAHSNFFRHYKPKGSLRVTVVGRDGRTATMKARAPHGSCNRCHRPGGAAPPVRAP